MADSTSKLPISMQKTTFTVQGMCCASEAALVQKILVPLAGVATVSVNVVSKTATVVHDPNLTPPSQIVESLNKAKLKAGIREGGGGQVRPRTRSQSWPSATTLASGVLMLVAMFGYLYPYLKWVALASIAVGITGMLRRSVAALRRCVLDINALMVIAVFGAVGLGDYLEGASVVFLFTLAEWLEGMSSDKARASLESLMNLAPRTAVIAESGERVDVKDVRVHTVVSVKAGEIIPVDGVVVSGRGTVDESSFTGEFLPMDKEINSKVLAGTIVLAGFINVETMAVEGDSAVARMVKLVEDAQNQRSNMEEFIEQFAKYYTPGVVMIAAGFAIIPWALGFPSFRQWIYLALVLLVVACPCALVISTPVAKACGLSAAAKMGLIFKGGKHMEVLAKIKAIAFDKTGTLTEGAFTVVDLKCVEQQMNLDQMLYWIASLENQSSHPMASALVDYARILGITPDREEVRDFKVIPGEGISGFVQDRLVQIGNSSLALRNGWLTEGQCQIEEAGITVGYVGIEDRFIGYFCVGDRVRGEASKAVEELQNQGIQAAVLTGDSKAAAELIHKQIGQNVKVEAGLAPDEKMKKIAELKERWGLTAMVGDGINDAPALAAADLGIAMGVAGSAVAMETADVTLMSNDLRKIPEAVKLSRGCLRKIYQNVALSIVVKLVFFGFAFSGSASLWAAVVADMGTCLLVIFNSLLLLKNPRSFNGVALQKESQKFPVTEPGKKKRLQLGDKEGLDEPLLAEERRVDQNEEKTVRLCGKGCCGAKLLEKQPMEQNAGLHIGDDKV